MTFPVGLFEFAVLASMKSAERQRATTPLVMTMLPGPPAQRSAVAAMAVSTQVKDGLRRERRVAEEVVEAVRLAAKDPTGFSTEKLRELPALRAVATDSLRDAVLSLTTAASSSALPAGTSTSTSTSPSVVDPKVVEQAAQVAALLVQKKGTKLTAAEGAKFPEFLHALTQQQRDEIIT